MCETGDLCAISTVITGRFIASVYLPPDRLFLSQYTCQIEIFTHGQNISLDVSHGFRLKHVRNPLPFPPPLSLLCLYI